MNVLVLTVVGINITRVQFGKRTIMISGGLEYAIIVMSLYLFLIKGI